MGIEPYQLAASLRGVLAQRLVRRLCPACRREAETPEGVRLACLEASFAAPARIFEPVGCDLCQGTGFRGRAPIGEGFLAGEPLLRAIAERRTLAEIETMARADGLSSMQADGLDKVVAGVTVFDEVMAAVHG
jgi:type II secretory ATPase GspE/PulE/Tfp pilus assembly ATPase PilB-like protein